MNSRRAARMIASRQSLRTCVPGATRTSCGVRPRRRSDAPTNPRPLLSHTKQDRRHEGASCEHRSEEAQPSKSKSACRNRLHLPAPSNRNDLVLGGELLTASPIHTCPTRKGRIFRPPCSTRQTDCMPIAPLSRCSIRMCIGTTSKLGARAFSGQENVPRAGERIGLVC